MDDSDEQLQANTYIWSQSADQITISFLVPETCKAKDLDIVIEHQYVRAGLKGQEPVLKGKLFAPVNHFESLWQLEKNSMSPFSSLTTSPSLSIASSYAFMSSPNHSPNSSMILPAPALAESATNDASFSADLADIYQQTAALGSISAQSSSTSEDHSPQPASPTLANTPPSIATPPMVGESSRQQQQPQQQQRPKYRILTIHLEKEQEGMEWAVPIAKGWKSDMDIDITSAYHLAGWFETRMADYENAYRYYLSAAERGHTPSMIKVAALLEADREIIGNKESSVLKKDLKKAFEWYKRAADAVVESSGTSTSNGPDALACYIVGTMYGAGSPEAEVEKDYEMALLYFNRAMNITAPRLDVDFGVLEQEEIPKACLRNHAPHTRDERYFCSAAFQTGLIYLYGSQPEGEAVHSKTHVDVDPEKAIRYWKEAALLGHAQASYNIGIMFANGMGVKQDLWQAGKWFGRAIKLDTTGKLVAPEGVRIVEWDAVKEEKASSSAEKDKNKTSQHRERKQRKKKSRRNRASRQDGVVFHALVAFGSIAAVAGVLWWWYQKTSRNEK